jgi:predicted nuclease of predicted toxin-antitoxin system
MRFLFDQNISHKILAILPEQFSGSTSVKNEGLINSTDKDIWEFAKKNDFIIVTQDSDFNDLNLLLGFPPKIIWIRTGNLRTKAILDILITYMVDIEKFISDADHGCFEIIKFKY